MKKNRLKNKLILEFTEFNAQRMGATNADLGAPNVNNPGLSTNAFDKHQDSIRQATSKINDILFNMRGSSAYSGLRSKLTLDEQDIQGIKILKIVKDSVHYDFYITIMIQDINYWGKVSDIFSHDPKFTCEVFRDNDLYQPREWVIKTKGLVIKTIKEWLKPEPGIYKLLNKEAICYSVDIGSQLKMTEGIEIELIRSHDYKIIVKFENKYYNLVDDNYIYFNWWFEKIN